MHRAIFFLQSVEGPAPSLSLCVFSFLTLCCFDTSSLLTLHLHTFFSLARTGRSHKPALIYPPLLHIPMFIHTTHPLLSAALPTAPPASPTPHPPPLGCTCVPDIGLDMAQIAPQESGKCSSCPIRRQEKSQQQTKHSDGHGKNETHKAGIIFKKKKKSS